MSDNTTTDFDDQPVQIDDGFGGMTIQKPKNFRQAAGQFFGLLKPETGLLVVITILTAISVVFTVLGPKMLGQATNIIFEGVISKQFPAGTTKAEAIASLKKAGHGQFADMLQALDLHPGHGIDFHALAVTLAWVLALYVIAGVFSWLSGFMLNDLTMRIVFRLRERVEEKINRLPLSYFDGAKRGDLLSRVTNDIDNIMQTLQQALSQVLTSVLTVVGILIMMFIVSPWLALVAILAIPATAAIAAIIGSRSQKRFVEQWKQTGVLGGTVEETFSGHALVKVYGRQQRNAEIFGKQNEALYKATFGAQFLSGIIMPAMQFVGNLSYVIIAVVGGLFVANGSMRVGDVQAFIQYSREFTQPLSQLGGMVQMFQSGIASSERVFELLNAPEQSPEPVVSAEDARARQGDGRLEFEHVAFGYSPEKRLIHDMNLVAEPGHTVAIVGPTGAGKTTLVNLIMRFYELDGGRITLDGVDISTMPRSELRARTGMVLQDTWLFEGSIRDNIKYSRPDATEEEMIAAAEATYVDRFVRSLPDGYDTVLDDEASNISTGEKQLITIARAFLAKPSVLILDEATSSVDTRTELLLQRAMANLRTDRTSFVIAHRLSTIRDADTILVMEHGDIVEQGSHDELLAAGGAYAALYNSQFEDAAA